SKAIAAWRRQASRGSTSRSPHVPEPGRRRLLLFKRAGVSSQSPRRSTTTPPISTQERTREVHRDQRAWRLCCADVVDDGCGLAWHHRSAPGCGPFRLVALRLASGSVRVCSLYDRAVVDHADHRALSSPWPKSKPKPKAPNQPSNPTPPCPPTYPP